MKVLFENHLVLAQGRNEQATLGSYSERETNGMRGCINASAAMR
jgi:hypothetical protein